MRKMNWHDLACAVLCAVGIDLPWSGADGDDSLQSRMRLWLQFTLVRACTQDSVPTRLGSITSFPQALLTNPLKTSRINPPQA